MFVITDEVFSTRKYLKYFIKDPKVLNDMSPLWLFVTEYPSCDSLLSLTSPKYLQTPALTGRQNFPSGISKIVVSPTNAHKLL